MTAADQEPENVMQIGSGMARLRGRLAYFDRVVSFPDRPVLVSEGDSWFPFPLFIDETIDDHPSMTHYIWSLDDVGDTLANSANDTPAQGGFEFLSNLRRHPETVHEFLFSGAGNDLIGEDAKTGRPMPESLLRPFNGNPTDIDGHIDSPLLTERAGTLRNGYREIVALVRAEPSLELAPIIFRGCDYPLPCPFSDDNEDDPIYLIKEQWFGRALAARKVFDLYFRRGIIVRLTDRLNEILDALTAEPNLPNVWVTNSRGVLPT